MAFPKDELGYFISKWKSVKDRQLLAFKSPEGSAHLEAGLSSTSRQLAIGEFLLNRNLDAFRAGMRESVKWRLRAIGHSSALMGQDGYRSYASHSSVFDALAADEFDLARDVAATISDEQPMEFFPQFSLVLKSLVSEEYGVVKSRSCVARNLAKKNKAGFGFIAYLSAFESLSESNESNFGRSLGGIANGHRMESRPGGAFSDLVDELICIYGLGLVRFGIVKMGFSLKQSRDPDILPVEFFSKR